MDSSGESKRARIERGQFLFVEMYGELFGIDLSGDGGSDSQISSLSGVIRCRLDLYFNDYPLGMCHVKMDDKHYLMGGLKRTAVEYSVEYSDDVYELDTDRCRISRHTIREPKDVLKPAVAGTRIKDPKIAKAFNLKGKHYLLHAWVGGYRTPSQISVPFERLDVAADADAAAPPFSCHKVPITYRNPSVASSRFIIDDKLVLFLDYYGQIHIFTPPDDDDDDDSGNGKWSCLSFEDYDDPIDSFLSFTESVPSTGIFLSEFRIPDPDDAIGVLLAFHAIFNEGKTIPSEDICAYAISTKTYKPKYFQKLGVVLSDLIPDYASMKEYFLEDLGKGDQEGARRICAIMIASGYPGGNILIPYVCVSVFDVQLIQPPPDVQLIQPPPGPRQFLKVFPPIKKLAFRIDPDEKFRHSPCVNAFLV